MDHFPDVHNATDTQTLSSAERRDILGARVDGRSCTETRIYDQKHVSQQLVLSTYVRIDVELIDLKYTIDVFLSAWRNWNWKITQNQAQTIFALN